MFNYDQPEDLRGRTIGLVRGTSVGEEMDKRMTTLFKVEDDIDAHEARFAKLVQNRMDALVFFNAASNAKSLQRELNLRYARNLSDQKKYSASLCVLRKPLATIELHIAQKKGMSRIWLEKLNRVILENRKNGYFPQVRAESGILRTK